MTLETVPHEGRRTAYRFDGDDGDGRSVLFVHGSGASHEIWDGQLPLASRHTLASVDLSGHGTSDDVDADPGWETLSAYASDVIAVAGETDADVLVGNSLGGAIVMHVALSREFDPDALVLVGTGAKLSVLDDLLAWLDGDFERAVEFLHGPDLFFHDADDALIDRSREVMVECGREVTQRDFLTCHEFDVRRELDRIDIPVLAVAGEHDRLTPVWYHEHLASEVPDGEVTVVEDAAHLAMLERPDRFNATLSTFLDRLQ